VPASHPHITLFSPGPDLRVALLDLNDFATFSGLRGKREIEKEGAKYVVRQVTQEPAAEILYEASGKPYLPNGPHLSVSHAHDKLALAFSTAGNATGIDIEKVRDKILAIRDRFLSPAELAHLGRATLAGYTLYWAAKEALYKACGVPGVIFAEELIVEPFDMSGPEGMIQARLARKGIEKKYTLQFKKLEDYVLVYTLACEE
jgi:4'-phosphopantetheinyl transferase